MQDFRGDNEEVLDVAPTTILIPNEYTLKRDVFAAIGADKDPNTANNGFNFNFVRRMVVEREPAHELAEKAVEYLHRVLVLVVLAVCKVDHGRQIGQYILSCGGCASSSLSLSAS